MKITRMSKGEWSKIRAYFDLETQEGFNIKGFKIIEGVNGLFVAYPSQKNKDNEYKDTIYADKELKQKVEQIALRYYNSNNIYSTTNNNDGIPF